jgi:hypothetical protein
VRPLHRPSALCRGVEEVAVAAQGRQSGLVADEVDEDQADPDRVRRDPEQDEAHGAAV